MLFIFLADLVMVVARDGVGRVQVPEGSDRTARAEIRRIGLQVVFIGSDVS
jgi:hypothetical protein